MVCKLSNDVSLGSLEEGRTVGIMCRSHDRTLHFIIDHTHVEIKLPKGDNVRLPSKRYAIVDLYGQHSAVELLPLQDVNDDLKAADLSISISKEELGHVKKDLERKYQHQEPPSVGGENNEHSQLPQHHQNGDILEQQVQPEWMDLSSQAAAAVHRETVVDGRTSSLSPVLPASPECVSRYQDCDYCKLCWAFFGELSVPGT